MRLHRVKEAEAAQRLLRHAEGRLTAPEVDHLLRLADQAALARWGRPVCFGFGSLESASAGGALSEAEDELLDEIFREYAGLLEGEGTGPSSYREMMEAEGIAPEDIEAIEGEMEELARIDALLEAL